MELVGRAGGPKGKAVARLIQGDRVEGLAARLGPGSGRVGKYDLAGADSLRWPEVVRATSACVRREEKKEPLCCSLVLPSGRALLFWRPACINRRELGRWVIQHKGVLHLALKFLSLAQSRKKKLYSFRPTPNLSYFMWPFPYLKEQGKNSLIILTVFLMLACRNSSVINWLVCYSLSFVN